MKKIMNKAMNKEEFAEKVEQLRRRLYRTALLCLGNEALAADALDEAVYKALKGLPRLRQPEYFDTWITRILINECRNELQRARRFRPMEELPETAAEAYDALPLKEAIQSLPQDLKEVIILRYFADYTLEQTAETLGIPRGTVSTRQRRALTLLRLELEEEVME